MHVAAYTSVDRADSKGEDTPIPRKLTTMSAIERELTQLHASVCKGLADPKRLLIINALRDGERAVSELADAAGISQANASQHLAVLREKGLVEDRRDGQWVFYRVTSQKIIQAMDLLREVMADQMPTSTPEWTTPVVS